MDAHIAPSALNQAIADYNENGAAVLRGVVSPEWISRGQAAIDAILQQQTDGQGDMNAPGAPRFFNGTLTWLHHPEIKALIFQSGLAEIAAQVMGASEVRFFYDQLLVKEPGAKGHTPWHQDLSYWPAAGEQITSIWIPFDPATPETGVVTYVKGSHRWKSLHRAVGWTDPRNPNAKREQSLFSAAQPELATLPDIDAHPERYEFLTWDMAPGDVILHHPLAVHGAPGNASRTVRRRALSLRWLGDDARWDNSHAHFMRIPQVAEMIHFDQQVQGEPFRGDAFPVVWPHS